MGIEKIVEIEPYHQQGRNNLVVWDIQVAGGDTFIYNGIVIHNSYVERGIIGGYVAVEGYYRKDGTWVRAHTKYMPPREGQKYIENSLRTSFEDFQSALDYNLKRRFKNVI